jgi:hypothetical protein
MRIIFNDGFRVVVPVLRNGANVLGISAFTLLGKEFRQSASPSSGQPMLSVPSSHKLNG